MARQGLLERNGMKRGKVSRNQCELPWCEVGVHLWEPVNGGLLKSVWVEFVCMILFVYIATGVVVFGCHSVDAGSSSPTTASGGQTAAPEECFVSSARVLTIATGFGLTISVLVYIAASFSGGHINPAVTLGFVLTNKISLLRAVLYWIVQFGGAIVGSALLYASDHEGYNAAKGASNRVLTGFPTGGVWVMECVLTFTLVLTVFAATDTVRAQNTAHLPVLAPLAIGLAVWIAHLAAIAIDGCSINPARSLGPAVIGSNYNNMWVWFIGPLSGGAIAALVYEITFRPSRKPVLPIDATELQDEELAKLPGYAGVQGLERGDVESAGHRPRFDSDNQEFQGQVQQRKAPKTEQAGANGRVPGNANAAAAAV